MRNVRCRTAAPSARKTAAVALGLAMLLASCAVPRAEQTGPRPTDRVLPAAAAVEAGAAQRRVPPNAGISPSTAFTPLAGSVTTTPQPVRGSDGRWHLAYELVLTNATADRVELDSVVVSADPSGRVLQTLSGAALRAASNPLGGQSGGKTVMAASSTWVGWLDVTVSRWSQVPTALVHRVRWVLTTPDGRRIARAHAIVRVPTLRRAAVTLGPPLLRGTWFASEGCCRDDTHHRRGLVPVNGRLMVPQRFAIDWYLLDSKNRAWVGDPSKLTSYRAYRKPIIAAAAGTVVARLDGMPNSRALPEPPPITPIEDSVGNRVIVKVSPGVYVLYAHMDPGSVQVRVGQRVRRGQLLGRIGTSGNSTVPHLHFQILTTRTFFPTDSRPWALDRFTLLGRVAPRIWDDNLGLQPSGTLPVSRVANPGTYRDRLPLDRAVIRFGAARVTPAPR